MGIRITAVQGNPSVGDLEGNIAKIRDARRSLGGKTDLIVFSECFVTGYPLGDLVLRRGFLRDARLALNAFAEEIRGDGGPAILVGCPREGGTSAYNSAFLIDTDGTMLVSDKHHLPNSEVYDEKRTFAMGQVPKPLPFRGIKLGVLICEDYWHRDLPRALAEEGADVLIVINGSHFQVNKQDVRIRLASDVAATLGLATLYVNQVGGQDELVFDGGSFCIDAKGTMVRAAPGFEPNTFTVYAGRNDAGAASFWLDNDQIFDGKPTAAYPRDRRPQMYQAMVLGLRDYVGKNGFRGVVIGMSGGIDSALSAAVAVDALGPDRVHLVRMPSEFTSSMSNDDAEEAARMLGCQIDTIAISQMVAASAEMLSPVFTREGKQARDVTEENIQARIRGMTLMALSNKLGFMVLTTGNKSEMSVGYATLYGDMCGGYSVLKDCYKTDVFDLSKWRNEGAIAQPGGLCFLGPDGAVMPHNIITRPPSAELSPGQTDEAALGSYDMLDAVLRNMIEGLNSPEHAAVLAGREIGREVPADYAKRIAGLVWKAQYKREQAPPGVVLTSRNFGKGWRLPIANAYGI